MNARTIFAALFVFGAAIRLVLPAEEEPPSATRAAPWSEGESTTEVSPSPAVLAAPDHAAQFAQAGTASVGSPTMPWRFAEWLEGVEDFQLAPGDDDALVTAVVRSEVRRLYGAQVRYLGVGPAFDAERLELVSFARVVTSLPGEEFRLLAFTEVARPGIALIVLVAVRDGLAAPGEYLAYPAGRRPPCFPALTEEEALAVVRMTGAFPTDPVERVFVPSDVSPEPIFFTYRFKTTQGTLLVSQDRRVWQEGGLPGQ